MAAGRGKLQWAGKFASMATTALMGKVSGAFVVLSGLIGIAADLGTPWANILGMLCPAVFALTLVFGLAALACSLSRAQGGPMERLRGLFATVSTYALTASLILGPFYGLQVALGAERGVLAEQVPAFAELQDYLSPRFDRIDDAIAVLTDRVEEQGEAMEQQLTELGTTMSYSVALEVMDRVRTTRDGANQGQTEAMRTLLANGFDFVGTDYSGVSFRKVVLDKAEFSDAKLHFVDLRGTSARGASFRGSDLRLAFADPSTTFAGANLSRVYAPLFEASAVSFEGADLSGGNFMAADLRDADFSGADLRGAAFVFADLRGANFSDAKLDGAHFVGALLTGADFSGAQFSETNLLGAALDPASLTHAQRTAACRHQATARFSKIEMTERRKSDRFASGFEYDGINEFDAYVSPGPVEDLSLRVCRSEAESAAYFNALYPFEERFNLDRDYLAQAGRRAVALDRFKAMRTRLEEGRADAVFLTGDGAYRDAWIDSMKARSRDVSPIGPAYVDSDFMLVFLLGNGAIDAEKVNWQEALELRLRLEDTIRRKFDGDYARALHWGPFFPDDLTDDDMPKETLALFREWTLARAKAAPDSIVLRPHTIVVDPAETDGATVLSFDTGYSRESPEGIGGSETWPSSSLAKSAAAAAGGADRLQFLPVAMWKHTVDRVLVAYPARAKGYTAKAETLISDIPQNVPDVDLTVRVLRIERLEASSRDAMLLHVEPVSASVRSPGKGGTAKIYPLTLRPAQ